jgi:hypothetical protein
MATAAHGFKVRWQSQQSYFTSDGDRQDDSAYPFIACHSRRISMLPCGVNARLAVVYQVIHFGGEVDEAAYCSDRLNDG